LLKHIPTECGVDNRKRFAAALGIFSSRPELSAIVTNANKEYRNRVDAHIPSAKELKYRITTDDMTRFEEALYKSYVDYRDYDSVKLYTLWCLVSGKYIAPRRNLDWIGFKLRNVDPAVDNYLDTDNNTFVFSQYKTFKIYGKDVIPCPQPVVDMIMEWSTYNDSDYLFPTTQGKRIAVSTFTTLVNSLSGGIKGRGVNQYRKTYLQTNFGNILKLDETMRAMGSSQGAVNSYIKAL
jgi:integrase